MNTIEKSVNIGGLCKSRLHVKSFKTSDSMHEFLNKQYDNNWKVSDRGLKTGVYAYCGGAYHNVKSLDASVLAHV